MRCACFLRLCEARGGYSLLKRLPRFGAEKHGFAVRISPYMGKRKCAAMRHEMPKGRVCEPSPLETPPKGQKLTKLDESCIV